MTQIIEMVAVSVDSVLEHSESNCPFCAENTPPEDAETVADASPEEDDNSDFNATKAIGNDSGELDKKMGQEGDKRPDDWIISSIDKLGNDHKVTPNPHHLVPGNESLKQSSKLLEWLFAGKGKIEKDVGYNVNNAGNGIWLPSNNSMRGNSDYADKKFKIKYAKAAMKAAGSRHFHDRHGSPYSEFVKDILDKIGTRMGIKDSKCPFQAEKSGEKFKPPYALIKRLNGVSGRLSGYLSVTDKGTTKVYTSKLVPMVWMEMDSNVAKYFK